MRLATSAGVIFLCAGLIGNEFVLGWLIAAEGQHGEQLFRVLVWAFVVVMLLLGAANIRYRRSALMVRIDLAFLSLVFSALCAEAFLRSRELLEADVEMATLQLNLKHAVLHHTLAPNSDVELKWGKRRFRFVTNDLGYRDVAVRRVLPHTLAEKRVLILGDSFGEAIGVNYKFSFLSRLQRKFEKLGHTIEFLNSAVGSYCPRLELRKLQQFFRGGYTTDAVLLLLDISDIHDETSDRWYGNWDEFSQDEMQIWQRQRAAKIDAAAKRLESLRLLRAIYPRIFGSVDAYLGKRGVPSKSFEHLASVPRYSWTESDIASGTYEWVEEGIARCHQSVEAIAVLCHERTVQFSLVIYPYPVQLASPHVPSIHQKIVSEFATQRDMVLIDLFPAFRSTPNYKSHFIEGDIHWNERGHALVARQLFARRSQWLSH